MNQALTDVEIKAIDKQIMFDIRQNVPCEHWDDLRQQVWLELLQGLSKHNGKYKLTTFVHSMMRFITFDYFQAIRKQGFTFTKANYNRPRAVCPDENCKHEWRTRGVAKSGKQRYYCMKCDWRLTELVEENPFDFAKAKREDSGVLTQLICNR